MLREVTDATLTAGLLSDRSRLIQLLSSATVEEQGAEAIMRRKATQ